MFHIPEAFTHLEMLPHPKPIVGYGGNIEYTGTGTARVPCVGRDGTTVQLVLKNVLYVPTALFNLVSVGTLRTSGCPMKFVPQGIQVGQNGIIAKQQNNLFFFKTIDQSPRALAAINDNAMDLWHSRLGHLGKQNVARLENMSTGMNLHKEPERKDVCEPCVQSKLHSLPHKGHIAPGKHKNELIHFDIFGPIKGQGVHDRHKWMFAYEEDTTKRSFIHFGHSKAEALTSFKALKANVEHGDAVIKRLHSDEDKVIGDKDFADYRYDHGIGWEPSIPGNPQMNGASERLGQTLHGKAHAMLIESKLPESMLPELLATANYLRNRSPVSGQDKTPFEKDQGSKPDLSHLKRIGQKGLCEMRRPPGANWPKFENRTELGRLVGYESNGFYRMLMPNGKVQRYSHVVWLNNDKRSRSPSSSDTSIIAYKSSVPRTGNETMARIQPTTDQSDPNDEEADGDVNEEAPNEPPRSYKPPADYPASEQRLLQVSGPRIFKHSSAGGPNPVGLLAQASRPEPYEPRTYKEAMADAMYKMHWQLSMNDEYHSLIENKTWYLVKLPAGRKALGGKWVYKLKRGSEGEVTRYKARWVVQGFLQREGIDFEETFASVVKPMSYKAIFALAAAFDLELDQMDVKTAFLYGDVDELVYVVQFHGFDDGSGRVCCLKKALYGLKQSPRVWYNTLATFLKGLGYRALVEDYSVFIHDDNRVIVAIYVDDILIAGPNRSMINQLKKALSEKFKMVDLGPCAYYLGMKILRDRQNRTLSLSQESYIEKILRDHDMWSDRFSGSQ